MRFTKLLLKNFGRFRNQNLDLKEGINLIVCPPRGGKSTITDFLVGMIYGIPRREGITKVRSNYELRKPEKGGHYDGTAYLKDGETSWLVERSFLAGARKTSVLDLSSGREVTLKSRDTLAGTVVQTDRNTCLDTRVIRDPGSRPGDKLERYMADMAAAGSAGVSPEKAVRLLEKEKKRHIPAPLIRRLNLLDEEITSYDGLDEEIDGVDREIKKLNEDFIIEAEKRKRVARRLVENPDGSVTYQDNKEVDAEMDRLTAMQKSVSPEEKEEPEEKPQVKFTDRIPVIFATGIFVILVIALIVRILPFEPLIRRLFVIFTAVFVALTIIDGFRAKGYFDSSTDVSTPSDEEFNRVLKELQTEAEQQEEAEFDSSFAREYAEKKAALKEKEDALLQKRTDRNRLRAEFDSVFKRKSELEDEVKAIDLAISRIRSISADFQQKAGDSILKNAADFVPVMTGGRYGSLSFGTDGRLLVETTGGSSQVSDLPEADARLLYLAVRLSVAKSAGRKELPVLIDGTEALDTPEKRQAFAVCAGKMQEEQMIILTDDISLKQVFSESGTQAAEIRLQQ